MNKYLTLFLLLNVLLACTNETDQKLEEDLTETEDISVERQKKAQNVFQTVPSPMETASIFHQAGANYNAEVLNPIQNVGNYLTSYQRAINFGVYGADLSYVNIFDQSQDAMFYMNCVKTLADDLGITSAFDAETMERLEENINNRDSLMRLTNDAFWDADAYLKENGQDNLSALIVVGGWIEGLYIGAKTLNRDNPEEELMRKIAEQKFSLASLMDLLATYEDEDVKKIALRLENLQSLYAKVEESEEKVVVDNSNKVATIEGGPALTYGKETIFEIVDEIDKIRHEVIQ